MASSEEPKVLELLVFENMVISFIPILLMVRII